MRLARKVTMQNDSDFVDVTLLHMRCEFMSLFRNDLRIIGLCNWTPVHWCQVSRHRLGAPVSTHLSHRINKPHPRSNISAFDV